MAIKESSDELNPPVITTGISIARPSRQRTVGDYLALGVATCGVGYLPLAPGTWGSIVSVGIYLLSYFTWLKFLWVFPEADKTEPGIRYLFTTLTLALIVCITIGGVWAATRVEKLLGRKDPGIVVIDEVAGQLISLLPILFINTRIEWPVVVGGFLLFRTFDIWKPYPIRRLEALESGWGTMADDLLAGAYAAIVLTLVTAIYFLS